MPGVDIKLEAGSIVDGGVGVSWYGVSGDC